MAVLISLMFVPNTTDYAHTPFFIADPIDGRQIVLQTIFLAVLFAVIVNIPWLRRPRK